MGTLANVIADKAFNDKSTASYNLSVLLGADRLSYLVVDRHQQVLLLRAYDFSEAAKVPPLKEKLHELYLEDELLRHSYANTTLAVVSPVHSLVPNRLFNEEQQEVYIKSVTSFPTDGIPLQDHIDAFQLHNCYFLEADLHQSIQSTLSPSKILHGASCLLQGFAKLAMQQRRKQVFVNVRHRLLQIVAFDNTKLLYCNSFPFQDQHDFIYYLMLAYDQLQFKPELVPVTLCGQLQAESSIYHLIYRYIRHIRLLPLPTFLRFNSGQETFPSHFYYDLFSLTLCE